MSLSALSFVDDHGHSGIIGDGTRISREYEIKLVAQEKQNERKKERLRNKIIRSSYNQ